MVADLYLALVQGKSFLMAGNDEYMAQSPTEDFDGLVPNVDDEPQDVQAIVAVEGNFSSAQPTTTPNLPLLKPGSALSSMPLERTNRVALRLLTRARASEQEQGINSLFAVFGLLKWQERPGEETWRYAPLVMLPIRVEENVREGSYRIVATGEDPEFNQTIAERLKHDFALDLNVELDEGVLLTDVFDHVRTAIGKQRSWEILEQAHVGMFQFHKLRMFEDLAEHWAIASQHEIVQALALEGVTIAGLPEGVPSEEELDRVVAPQHSFTVLDADASQLRAVQAANRGGHLIVQGPPGTGKSQTISNMIAESVAAGKTVLFVSEKAAAIEVVYRRLAERGLGDFCLMLHSQKANKRDVIYELGARLSSDPPPASSPQEDVNLKRLETTRALLNAYPTALHRERPSLARSAFWAHGELAALLDVPYLRVAPPAVDDLTSEQLDGWSQLVDQAARYASVLQEGPFHPWSGLRSRDLTLANREMLGHTLAALRGAAIEVQTEGTLLAQQMSLTAPTTLYEARNLMHIVGTLPSDGNLLPAWFSGDRIRYVDALAKQGAAHAAAIDKLTARLFTTYSDKILAVATPEALASYESGPLARLVSSAYRRSRALMREAAKGGQQLSIDEERSALRDGIQIQQHLAWFEEQAETLGETLGLAITHTSFPDSRVWARRVVDVEATAAILARFPTGSLPAAFVETVSRPGIRSSVADTYQRLNAAIAQAERRLADLDSFLMTGSARIEDNYLADATLELIRAWVDQRLSRFDDLDPWLRAQDALVRVDDAGISQVVGQLLEQQVPSYQWSQSFRRLMLTHWLDQTYRDDDALHSFRGEEREATIAQFRDLDRDSLDKAVRRIRRTLASRQTQVSTAHGGEPGLLRHEAAKRKRHVPLRRLFERIPNLLPTLKPCLMMSPLSVAQFLPADRYKFDIVIFDEASQVRPHDAIGAIMRGRQLVVAGDSKQLPPTAFFDRATDEGTVDEEQDLRALESILDGLNVKGMRSVPLLWHYRSRHEDLISYSNHHFYDRRLITFPSAAAEGTPTKGVRLEYVPNGRYEDNRDRVLGTSVRVNRNEARRVAELVLHHARTRPDESLGVVALGMNQRDIVDEEIKQARLLDQTLDDFFRPENFFVKALEQVQGDERDVIMISVGYGKNAQGVLSHNFGPINQDGGERRLNVLVTRARHQVIVVSSIRAGDIDLTKTQKLGPRLLKSYLDFAERGPIALQAEITGGDGEYESPFEAEVGEALKRSGYTVHRQVGTSKFRIDLAIVDPRQPGRYVVGIECDGRTYHQSKTARDRDRLRQEILEGLGWNIHRIWSTDWIRNRDREVDRLTARVTQLLSDGEFSSNKSFVAYPSTNGTTNPHPGLEDVAIAIGMQDPTGEETIDVKKPEQARTTILPYRVADVPVVGYGDILSAQLSSIVDAIEACVLMEGPIHRDLLARRITTSWGHQRAGARINGRIEQAIAIAADQRCIRQEGVFLWTPGYIDLTPRGPALDGWVREIAHIAAEEIVQGMMLVLRHAFSLNEAELILQTARLFGYQRTGQDINRRLTQMVRLAVEGGFIEAQGDRYQLPRQEVVGMQQPLHPV